MPLAEPSPSAAPRAPWLWLAAALPIVALWMHGPIAQWADYHSFADRRDWLGVPNAANVLSNLPFLAVGAWAFWRLRGADASRPSLKAWRVFALALAGIAIGSTIYHWAPSNATLVADRLPIAWACVALLSAFLGERASPRWCGAAVLAAALVVATFSVAWWWWTEGRGRGDLRPYLYVQLLSMLLVPLGLWLRPAPVARPAAPDRAWWTIIACYAAAKLMEATDDNVYDAIGHVSGHTLKHLLAAAGTAVLLHAAVQAHEPAPAPAPEPQLR